MRYVCSEPRAPPAAWSRPRDAEWAYRDSGVRTGVRNWPGAAITFIEFCLQGVLPVLLCANGRATSRWLDNANTDIDYRNYNINNTMDHNTNVVQGSPPGGGVQTRSRSATGKRRANRAKAPTPSGPRGSRTPASAAKTTSSRDTGAECTGPVVLHAGFVRRHDACRPRATTRSACFVGRLPAMPFISQLLRRRTLWG